MGSRYYVVQTQPGAEQIARANLENQKLNPFLPCTVKTTLRLPRGWKAIDPTSLLEPLFPGYLFVNFDITEARWRAVAGTRGCQRLLGEGEYPTAVPPGVVEDIIALHAAGVYQRQLQPAAPARVQASKRGRIVSGSFEGLVGLCLATRGKRVQMLMSVFGGAVKATFAIDQVEPVPA